MLIEHLYLHILYCYFVTRLFWFYHISTIVGYLMPNPLYIYMHIYIYVYIYGFGN